MHPYQKLHPGVRTVSHLIAGNWRKEAGPHRLNSPYTGEAMFELKPAPKAWVDEAVQFAKKAQADWGSATHKERARVLFGVRDEILKNMKELSATVSFESGKTVTEAEAGLMKGIEILEYALSLQNLDLGGKMEVSRGVFCEYRRIPLGVVAGITPFNFPAMVPMWMIPIAIAAGNAFIWKPSDKVAMTPELLAACFERAGLPKGILSILHGGKETVDAILDHHDISAVGFVGSTNVAKEIYRRGTANLKRVLALGGAKNHILLFPDADPEMAAQGIADSFTGCAGQRCMAASVLLAVGPVDGLIEKITRRASMICAGDHMGAVISKEQLQFLHRAIAQAEKDGAKVLLDGRTIKPPPGFEKGNWLGPTVIDHVKPGSEAATHELFGPVLSIIRCKNVSEAFEIERSGDYGNATSVFTQSGAIAEEVAKHSTSGMVGVNIGVPVPREPFSFGGLFESRFGAGDITGQGGLNFWSDQKKITTKWAQPKDNNWMS